ncbi:Pex28p PWA37_002367 [Arxiozyma heterogenica]|uniref:Pex28p n=1 Tax=Arxiozyma heterogenica TaxID=278026 RepID=UPI002EECBD4A
MTENVNEKTAAAKDKGIIRKFLENKYDQLLNSILDVTEDQIVLKSKLAHSDVAENQIDRKQKRKLNHIDNLLLDREIEGLNYFTEQQTVVSNPTINNKELIYHAISTFINASIDKIRLDRMTKSFSLPATQEKNDTSIDTILENDTFLDIFMERLLSRIIRDKLPEREHITEKETSHKEKHAQLVSPSILASNLGKMSKQLNSIFEFQDSFIRLLTWKTPSYTILTLLIISLILFHPLYLILLPILYIAYGLITPSYTQKHNLRNFDYHLKKQYGKSLLEVISSGGKPVACTSNPFKDQINDPIEDLNLVDWEDSNSGLKFITTIRDFQNMTTNLLALTNSISKFIYETASFKDERKTTILFLKCIVSYILFKVFSSWINWPLFFSCLIWLFFMSLNPKWRSKFKYAVGLIQQRSTTKKNNLETVGQKNEIGNIIIDTTPQIKEIEIFEIYRKGLIPGEWKFFLYSNNVFDYNDQYRKAQKSPPGVKTLDELYPPKTWKFDNNSTWNIDKNVQEWAYYRGLLDLEIDKEFLCDNMFKRRRLTRKVLK